MGATISSGSIRPLEVAAAAVFAAQCSFAAAKIGLAYSGAAAAAAFAIVVCALGFIGALRLLLALAPKRLRLPSLEIIELPAKQPEEELLLTEVVHPANDGGGAADELVLTDVLGELEPDSRVIRLFDVARIPTPGQLQARIDRHLRAGQPPASAPADATEALHQALTELRRSLR